MNFLLLIIFIFWIAVMVKNTLFWVYLWQVKEYRPDRMRVHFELRSARKLFLNKRMVWLLAILALSLAPVSVAQFAGAAAALIFYGFFVARAVGQLQAKNLKMPRFTLRALLIILFTFTVYGFAVAAAFFYAPDYMLAWFIIGDIIISVIALLGVLATFPFSHFLKKRLIKKAIKKRDSLKDLLVIGVTGSYGKSSTKEIVSTLLAEKFKIVKTPKNTNVDIGIAKTILKDVKDSHEIFVAEMGAYKKGEIASSARVAKPQIGVLTGISGQHISLFGSLQNIQEAKYELIESLPGKGLALFNGDNEYTRELFRKTKIPKRLYATAPEADINYQTILLEKITTTKEGIVLKVKEKESGDEHTINTALLGEHNALNIMAALTVARELGMGWDQIKDGLSKISPPPHTLQIKKGIKDSTVIDDTYSANVNGVLAALDVLKQVKGNNKILIIHPLIELGNLAETAHKQIAAKISEVCDYCIVTGKDYFTAMQKEALDNGMEADTFLSIAHSRAALRKAQELTDKGDVILLENRIPGAILKGLTLHE